MGLLAIHNVVPVIELPVGEDNPRATFHEFSTPLRFKLNQKAAPSSVLPLIEKTAQLLMTYPSLHLFVNGYTDNSGKPAYNKLLSRQRALSVARELIKRGIDPERIQVKGFGSQSPAADNRTRNGRAKNRRVVMHIEGFL